MTPTSWFIPAVNAFDQSAVATHPLWRSRTFRMKQVEAKRRSCLIIGKWTPRCRLLRRKMNTRRALVLRLADAEQCEKAPLVRKIRVFIRCVKSQTAGADSCKNQSRRKKHSEERSACAHPPPLPHPHPACTWERHSWRTHVLETG